MSRSTFDIDRKRVRLDELRTNSTAPGFWDDPPAAQKVMAELSRLSEDVTAHDRMEQRISDVKVLWELASGEQDEATASEAAKELAAVERDLGALEVSALLSGEFDDNPAILEVHAGEGGTDSQDWAEILLRMYQRWAEREGFKSELVEVTPGEEAGIKGATLTL